MTVRRGQSWGRPGPLPSEGVVAGSDAEVRRVVLNARQGGRPVPVIGLLGGDLARTLGGPGDESRLRSPEAMTFDLDVVEVHLDGRLDLFVAHLVAHTLLWGHVVAAMSAQWVSAWDVAPRAHPGDGRIDVMTGRLRPFDRLKARARLPLGTHVPHPDIEERRVRATEIDLPARLPIRLDGEPVGRAQHISLKVVPDALVVVV